jgi:sarcosine oxidase
MDRTYDVIVIGLGAVGAAATYQLALAGARVLGLDRYAPPHTLGSSHGETRITRLACGEGVDLTPFARRSHQIWRTLEGASGKMLLVQNGLLVVAGAGPRAAAHGNRAFLETSVAAARAHHVAHELLANGQIRRRFPAFNVGPGDEAYFEPEAGFVFPERCISAELDAAKNLGATVHVGETVTGYAADANGVRVTTSRGSYSAAKLIIAAGPWLPTLLPKRLAAHFTVRRQLLCWFRLDRAAAAAEFAADRFPVFYWQLPREQAIYGFPSLDGRTIKIATEQYVTATTPETVDRTATIEETQAMHRDYVAPFFPAVSEACVRSEVCLYTCTDGARFLIE